MTVNRTPPIAVARAAAKGLKIRSEQSPSNKAMRKKDGTPSQGVYTARQLISGKPISIDLIQTMVAWFARHDANEKEVSNRKVLNSKAQQSFLAWGGAPGRAWAKKTLRRIQLEE